MHLYNHGVLYLKKVATDLFSSFSQKIKINAEIIQQKIDALEIKTLSIFMKIRIFYENVFLSLNLKKFKLHSTIVPNVKIIDKF